MWFLRVFVFVNGAGVMGVEMAASRLLAPYFGTSLLVWTNLIGLVMIALALGYFWGGRLADRHPRAAVLYGLTLAGGALTAFIPVWTRPVFAGLQAGILNLTAGAVVGSFLASALAFVPPVLLLGCVSPFALRLATRAVETSGKTAGGLYGVSTLGSIVGLYAASFLCIPLLGTRETLFAFSLAISAVSLWGLWRAARLRWAHLSLLLVPLLCYGLTTGSIHARPGLIYETETPYQFIQVLKDHGRLALTVNEGGGIQSVLDLDRPLFDWYSDYVLLTPYLLAAGAAAGQSPPDPPAPGSGPDRVSARRLLLIGLAGGSIPRQFARVERLTGAPPVQVDAVEIDPGMVAVARRYFGLQPDEAEVAVADARVFLARTDRRYDIIVSDAYARELYIPFQLATTEFFALVRRHLNPGGLLVLNVNVTRTDAPLLRSLLATVAGEFRHVYWAKLYPDRYNVFIFAAASPLDFAHLAGDALPALLRPLGRSLAGAVHAYAPGAANPPALVLTDDRAPTEFLTDAMILSYGR